MIKYPSIEQFKNVIKEVASNTRYAGTDESGHPIYNNNPLPVLTFTGTVKTHGSNASCVYNVVDETLTAQSRTRELSPLSDNYGFCAFMLKNETLIKDLCETILRDYDTYNTVVIYGEWFGKGINSGCAIHQLDRKFAIFGIRLLNENSNKWIDGIDLREMFTMIDIDSFFFTNDGITLQKLNDNGIYCITQFGIWVIDIDFNHPELVQNKIINITNKIEEECPVGKFFGVSGTGEGVVFSHNGEHFYQFKSKGEKHSLSTVKTLAPIDEELYNNIKDFAENYTSEVRLEQGITFLRDELQLEISPKNTGAFIKWVVQDVIKEEQNNIIENGFDFKKVAQAISKIASKWYLEHI